MKKRTVTIASEEVEVDIVRSSRRTIALYVRPGGSLQIRAPWYVPIYSLMQFIHQKTNWILRQRENAIRVEPAAEPEQLSDGSLIPFLGRKIAIRVCHDAKAATELRGDELFVCVKGEVTAEALATKVDMWYLSEAKRYFATRTHELAAVHSDRLPSPGSIRVRRMKQRWGTCHPNGNIMYNRELLKKEPALIDYVIIHELCHLVHHNHGKRYYALLERLLPDYRELRRRLRKG